MHFFSLSSEIRSVGMGRWTIIVNLNDFRTNKEGIQPSGGRSVYRLGKNRMVPWHCMVHYRMRDWTWWHHKSNSQCEMLITI